MIIGSRDFKDNERPYIMGILNVTPDSFSDGGLHNKLDDALFATENMINEGADIIDVGGESTRPGHTLISDEEEISRVVPVISEIKKRFDTVISLDTYKSEVAKAGIEAGADMINDVWGLKWDNKMADIIAKSGVSCCIMHNRRDANYVNFLQDVISDINESMDMVANAGIPKEKIMVDPGIGFAKSLDQNLIMMNNLKLLQKWGVPVLLGTSRKSMIGLTLDLPVTEREEGTIATQVIGLMSGCSFFRVHDVRANYRALKMAWEILKK